MRIAVVSETYPPEVNGVARTLGRLVDGLAGRGHEVVVYRPRQGRHDRPDRNGAASERVLPGAPIPLYSSLRFGLPASGRLRRDWRRQAPDVVHLVTEGPLGWSALRAAGASGVPVTSSFHTNFHLYSSAYGIGPLQPAVMSYLRWFHNRTRTTMVPSRDALSALATRGFRRLQVLGRGVDTELFDSARRSDALRASWGAKPVDPVALYVGRLAPEKNLALAARTFLDLRKVDRRTRFVLVGDGPERSALQRRFPDFVFAGTRHGEDLAAHYASADLFLFPSLTETYGNVVVEAMASGLVVVAFDYAAAALHIRDGDNGRLAPLGNSSLFVRAATDLLRRPTDLRQLGRRARASARRADWGAVVEHFERLLHAAAIGPLEDSSAPLPVFSSATSAPPTSRSADETRT